VCAPRAAAAAAISTANAGSLVVMSTSTVPGRHAETAPSSPSSTSRTSWGNPTIEKTTSLAAATSAGVSAQVASSASRPSARSRVRVVRVTG